MSREDQILDWISAGLNRFSGELDGYRVYLFGSRAKQNHRTRSDFDIGVFGDQAISLKTFYKIEDFLEDLPTLYRIDWVDLNRTSDSLRENAIRNAKVIYG
jgi:predicted nucleotidyltransferase